MDNKKRTINRTITDTPVTVAVERLHIHTYERVARENIAARAAKKSVDCIHKIYHCIDQEGINKLFDDLFCVISDFLEG